MLNRLPPSLADLIARLLRQLPAEVDVLLVGGAVRDLLLGRPVHDLDLVMAGEVLNISRQLADVVGAAYYPLDEARQTARIILQPDSGERQMVDIAARRGPSLTADLEARDFTINAIALDLRNPDKVIDPLGGVQELHRKILRTCSATSLNDDPVRIVRAVRLAFAYQLRIEPQTQALIRAAAPLLARVSAERQRDELFRILGSDSVAPAIRMLDHLDILVHLLPELVKLKGVAQSKPHVHDVWEHTLDTVRRLTAILDVLRPEYAPEGATNLLLGLVALRLGRFRSQIHSHLSEPFTPDRSVRHLLMMSALYHDIGKPVTPTLDEEGRIRFINHQQAGAEIALQRAAALRLSTDEMVRFKHSVQFHMRPMLLAQDGVLPTRRAIYRYFKDTGKAGVDICLISLADYLATYGTAVPQDGWRHHLDVILILLEAWWENPNPIISPPPLVKGHQLMKVFGLSPGPQIGSLLDAIQEAQASGEVTTQEQALILAEKMIKGE